MVEMSKAAGKNMVPFFEYVMLRGGGPLNAAASDMHRQGQRLFIQARVA